MTNGGGGGPGEPSLTPEGTLNYGGETDSLLTEAGPTSAVEELDGGDMTGASKEQDPATAAAAAGTSSVASAAGDSTASLVYSFAKKVVTVGIIYFVGYMGWSVAWLITPVILSVARDQWRTKNETRRNVAKASALANDKDVILARLGDLPAWVSKVRLFLFCDWIYLFILCCRFL